MITSLPLYPPRNPRRHKHKCAMRSAPQRSACFPSLSPEPPNGPTGTGRGTRKLIAWQPTGKTTPLPTPQTCAVRANLAWEWSMVPSGSTCLLRPGGWVAVMRAVSAGGIGRI